MTLIRCHPNADTQHHMLETAVPAKKRTLKIHNILSTVDEPKIINNN